jgi:outer membrane protein assembly factor BamB
LTGKLLWELKGCRASASRRPFERHGLLFISSGYIGDPQRPGLRDSSGRDRRHLAEAGETSNQYIAWSMPTLAPYNPTPLVYGDYYYTLFDRGFFTCHDAKTGREIYGRQRIATDASGFTASPWAYNGKIFALSEDGDTYVIQAGRSSRCSGRTRSAR